MKNIVKLDHYYCPEELEEATNRFVNYNNHQCNHVSLDKITPGVFTLEKKIKS